MAISELGSSPSNEMTAAAEMQSHDLYDYLTIGILTALFFIGAPINLAVFFQLTERFSVLNNTDRLKFQLIISDLLIQFVYVVSKVCWHVSFYWRGGVWLCKAVKFGHEFSFQFSSAILAAIATDRCLNVLLPFRSVAALRKRTTVLIYTSWLYSAIVSSPQLYRYTLYTFRYNTGNEPRHQCVDRWRVWDLLNQTPHWLKEVERGLNWFHILTVFFLPLTIMSISYAIIGRQVWRYYRGDPAVTGPQIQFQESAESQTVPIRNSICHPFIAKCRRKSLEAQELKQKLSNGVTGHHNSPPAPCATDDTYLELTPPRRNSPPSEAETEGEGEKDVEEGSPAWALLPPLPEDMEADFVPEPQLPVPSQTYAFKKQMSIDSGPMTTGRSFTVESISYNPKRQRRLPIQTLKATLGLITIYIICWLPYHAAALFPLFETSSDSSIGRRVSTIVALLIVVTSVVNPFIYGFFSSGGDSSCDIRACWREVTRKDEVASVSAGSFIPLKNVPG